MYDEVDLYNRQSHASERLQALSIHRRFVKEYGITVVVSSELIALVFQQSCWNSKSGNFRDLKTLLTQDLIKASYLDEDVEGSLSLSPSELTCRRVQDARIEEAWIKLLASVIEPGCLSSSDIYVATWPKAVQTLGATFLDILIGGNTRRKSRSLLLVWDETSWIERLASRDFWPDLKRCVDLYFLSDHGMRQHPQALRKPVAFECTRGFIRSVNELCDSSTRRALIKALSKRVYGIHDASLRDESFKRIRRFRVTDFWRVHYRSVGSSIVLEEFGPHNMGM